MKKKKMPIIPIVALVVLLGYVGYSSLPPGKPDKPAPDQQQDSKKDVASDVSTNLDKPAPNTDKSPGEKGPMRKIERSSLLKADPSSYKPKPNPSGTASQWYQHGAADQ